MSGRFRTFPDVAAELGRRDASAAVADDGQDEVAAFDLPEAGADGIEPADAGGCGAARAS